MLSSSPVRDGGFQRGGAPRSESIITMIAGGNHTAIYVFDCGSNQLSAPLAGFFWYFSCRSKKSTYASSFKRYPLL